MNFRGLCRAEALKAQAGNMAIMVRRIKDCVSLEGLCEPHERTFLPFTGAYGTRSTGDKIENL